MFWAARALHWRMQRAYNLGRKVWVISKFRRDGDRLLQLLIFNEEFLVNASHQLALITSLPFVHTARRSYRLNDPVRPPDWGDPFGSPDATLREAVQTLLFRGRRSRNKVSVGEPAEGSLTLLTIRDVNFTLGQKRIPQWGTKFLIRLLFKDFDSILWRTRMDSP